MIISAYSIIASVILYNICLAVVVILSRRSKAAAKRSVSLLLFFSFLAVLRVVLPVSMEKAYVIRSYSFIPAIEDFLKRPLVFGMTPGRMLFLIWGLGAVIAIIRLVGKEYRFRRKAASYEFIEREDIRAVADELGLSCAIFVSPDVPTPFTANIFHPVIYLPDIELSEDEWKTVLKHERIHIRAYDNLKKLFFLLIEALFWWNPLARLSGEEITELLELRCDDKATAGMTGLERTEYGETLLKVAALTQQSRLPAIASAAVTAGERLKRRITVLIAEDEPHGTVYRRVVTVLLAALFVMSYFVIVQPYRYAEEEAISTYSANNDFGINIGSLDSNAAYILIENGNFDLYISGVKVCPLSQDDLQIEPFNMLPIIEGENQK